MADQGEESKVEEPMHQRLLTEREWRVVIGDNLTRGWQQYLVHPPESHALLLRRQIGTDPLTGRVNLLHVMKSQAAE